MHTPTFWKSKTWRSNLLLPAAWLYGYIIRLKRGLVTPLKISVPVICIGNAVAGGSGKTPVTLALGKLLNERGIQVHALSRGYKGRLKGPVRVDPEKHTARDVGDEPLLLAKVFPTWVSKDRRAGARAAVAAGAELIIMDDGFQNPALHKDVSLLVIDGDYGFGNGRLLPAGPLREPVEEAFRRADAVVLMGEDRAGVAALIPPALTVHHAHLEALPEAFALRDVAVLAFAGIARPRKFYRTLQQLGADVRKMVAYPDHHAFTHSELQYLRRLAGELEAKLVTTEKDYVRLPQAMQADVNCVQVRAVFEGAAALLQTAVGGERKKPRSTN